MWDKVKGKELYKSYMRTLLEWRQQRQVIFENFLSPWNWKERMIKLYIFELERKNDLDLFLQISKRLNYPHSFLKLLLYILKHEKRMLLRAPHHPRIVIVLEK